MARWNKQGEMEFLGRRDHQVKVRGYRIELGEIDAALLDSPGVVGAATVYRATKASPNASLIAYVSGDFNTQALREHLSARLPRHMVPSDIVALEELPLTANGKIDQSVEASCVDHRRGMARSVEENRVRRLLPDPLEGEEVSPQRLRRPG